MDRYKKRLAKLQARKYDKHVVYTQPEEPQEQIPGKLYPANPKIGIIIGTYGTPNYIRLHLARMSYYYRNVRVIVHDDSSDKQEQLYKICSEAKVEFASTASRLGWLCGDIHALLFGLEWAKLNNLDILVKFSRRFIPLKNFIPDLINLALESQYTTFGNRCEIRNYDFKTEAYAVSVRAWIPLYDTIVKTIHARMEDMFVVEQVVHRWAHIILNKHKMLINTSFDNVGRGYAIWDFVKNSRDRTDNQYLWHLSNSVDDYVSEANRISLPWVTQA